MSSTAAASTGRVERERRVQEAIHSAEMEGSTVDPAASRDSDDYIAGVIDSMSSWLGPVLGMASTDLADPG